MEPVISPWIIYLLGVCDNLEVALLVFIILAGLLTVGVSFATLVAHSEEEEWRGLFHYAKTAFVFLIIFSVLRVSMPSRKTLICMVVANEITEDRVSLVANKTGEAVGSVREIIKKDIIDIILATKKQAGNRSIKNHE